MTLRDKILLLCDEYGGAITLPDLTTAFPSISRTALERALEALAVEDRLQLLPDQLAGLSIWTRP